jgi:hypothetical protein
MSTRRGARAVTAVPTAAVQITHAERTAVTMRAMPRKRPALKAEVISFPNPWLAEYRNRLLEAAKGAKGANGAEGGSDAAAELEALKSKVEELKQNLRRQAGQLQLKEELYEADLAQELSSRDELIESLQDELAKKEAKLAKEAMDYKQLQRDFDELEDQIAANEDDIEDQDDNNNGLVSGDI